MKKNESFRVDGEQLFYPAIPLDVAFIRATSADPAGNLSLEKEALLLDNLVLLIVFLLETSATSKLLIPHEKNEKKKTLAMAAKRGGGLVIAQVERLVESHSLPTRSGFFFQLVCMFFESSNFFLVGLSSRSWCFG